MTDETPIEPGRTETLPKEVLEGVRRRDPASLEALFEFGFDRIYGLAFRMLGDRARAEDVVQEVYLRVHRSAERIDLDRDPMPWLRTITANLCRDIWRSARGSIARRTVSIEGTPAVGEDLRNGKSSPPASALAAERERLVQGAINALPEQLRAVVVLRDYEGLEHKETARILGLSGAAVRKRYSRALKQLAESLGDDLS